MEGSHPREVYFSWGDLVEEPQTDELFFSLGDIVGPSPQELYFSCADIVAYKGPEHNNVSPQIPQHCSKSTGNSFYSTNSNGALLESDVDNSQYDETESNLSTGLGSTNTSVCLSATCDDDESEDGASSHADGIPIHQNGNEQSKSTSSFSGDSLATKHPEFVERAEDDTSAHPQPPGHVDYLSYDWREEEIWASRKYVMSMRGRYGNLGRLDNALWRSWEKTRSRLKPIAPENINWLKDGDVTWLYGPLQPVFREPFKGLSWSDAYGQISTTRCSLNKKPTLKTWSRSEIMLHKSLSAFSLLKQAASAVQFQPSTPVTTPGQSVVTNLTRPSYKYSDGRLPSLLATGIAYAVPEKNVRFHDTVEQFIATETADDESFLDESRSDCSNIDRDSDSDSDVLEMILKAPRFGLQSNAHGNTKSGPTQKYNPKRATIKRLPHAPLKLKNDPLETFLEARNKDRFRDLAWLRPFQSRETVLSAETLTCRRFGDNNDNGLYKKCTSASSPCLSKERRSEIEAWALNHLELAESKNQIRSEGIDWAKHTRSVDSVDDIIRGHNETRVDRRKASERFERSLGTDNEARKANDFLEMCYDENPSTKNTPQVPCRKSDDWNPSSTRIMESLELKKTIRMHEQPPRVHREIRLSLKPDKLKDVSFARSPNNHDPPRFPKLTPTIHLRQTSLTSDLVPGKTSMIAPVRNNGALNEKETQNGTVEAGPASPNSSEYQTSETEENESDFGTNHSQCVETDYICENPEHTLEEILDPMKQALVNRVMDELWVIFNQTWSANITQHAGDSSAAPSFPMGGTGPSGQTISGTSQRKRQRSDNDEGPPDENNEKRPQQPEKSPKSIDSGDRPRFACPFRKHNPRRYNVHSHSVCALSSWETIARVKEHLYRCHQMPFYCKRCLRIFKTQQQLDGHIMVDTALVCDVVSGNQPEGITPENEKRLKSKKKSHPNQTDEDRWRDIYRLLFPHEDVPCPYFEPVREDSAPLSPNSRDLASYESYIRRELPRMVRSDIEELVRQQMQPFEASLVGSVVGIIQDCQDRIFRAYRQEMGDDDEVQMQPSIDMEPNESLALSDSGFNERQMGEDQDQPSGGSAFLDAVFQHPPPLQSMDQCASALPAFDHLPITHLTNDIIFSDSGYASEQMCNCPGPCVCLSRTTSAESRDAGTLDLQDGDIRDGDFQWHDWSENFDLESCG